MIKIKNLVIFLFIAHSLFAQSYTINESLFHFKFDISETEATNFMLKNSYERGFKRISGLLDYPIPADTNKVTVISFFNPKNKLLAKCKMFFLNDSLFKIRFESDDIKENVESIFIDYIDKVFRNPYLEKTTIVIKKQNCLPEYKTIAHYKEPYSDTSPEYTLEHKWRTWTVRDSNTVASHYYYLSYQKYRYDYTLNSRKESIMENFLQELNKRQKKTKSINDLY